MVKIYVEEVIKCMMERLTKEYGLTEQQALKEIDICMERLTKEYGLTEQQALKEIDICMERLYVKWMQNEPIPEEYND